MPESTSKYYDNSLCFQDLSKIDIWNNWFDSDFKNLAISIVACDPDTYKGECKSDDEIDRFLKENIFYIIFQKTKTNVDIYKDTQDI